MKIDEIIMIAAASVYLILLIVFLRKVNKPLKYLLFQGAIGIVLIIIINLTTFVSGLHIPVNYGTVISAVSGGIPFLGGIIIINKIFML